MCCSTGVCGTDINPDLVNFAALLAQLSTEGLTVQRFNMGQQPVAFAENEVVKALIGKEGMDVLPLIFLNDDIYLKGRYPTAIERPAFTRAALGEDK